MTSVGCCCCRPYLKVATASALRLPFAPLHREPGNNLLNAHVIAAQWQPTNLAYPLAQSAIWVVNSNVSAGWAGDRGTAGHLGSSELEASSVGLVCSCLMFVGYNATCFDKR